MEKHITILGTLYIIFSALGLLFGVAVAFFLMAAARMPHQWDDDIFILDIIGLGIGLLSVLLSGPGIIGGIGLLKRKNWARILVIILGCISLIHIPFGTALGVYTLWALLKEETVTHFAGT